MIHAVRRQHALSVSQPDPDSHLGDLARPFATSKQASGESEPIIPNTARMVIVLDETGPLGAVRVLGWQHLLSVAHVRHQIIDATRLHGPLPAHGVTCRLPFNFRSC